MTATHDATAGELLRRGPLRVLIVDDALSTRRLLHAVLGSVRSFEVVDEVGTGEEAIKVVRRLRPDVVLLDLSLPDMDGASVLSEILSCAPATKVVILSNTARRAAPQMVGAGATGFIEKGLPPLDLLEQLSRLLHVHPLRPAESVGEFLGSNHTYVPSAVTFDTNPTIRRHFGLVLAGCGIQIVAEVVSETDVAHALQSAMYMTRPSIVIIGEGGPTADLINRAQQQSPRTPLIVYASEPPEVSLQGSRVCVVSRPNVELLERTVSDVMAPSTRNPIES